MAIFCLTKENVNKFLKGLRSGEIDPIKLGQLSSEERHSYLSKFVGEDNAKQVNSLFESKLLLKNQQAGMISWAKKVGGLTTEAKRDLITRIEKLDTILNPGDEPFLKDLASTKLGTDITQAEAKQIFDLSQKAQDLRANILDDKSRVAYGNALLDLQDYTDSLTKKGLGLGGNIINVANAPRTIMSSIDFSAPLRQGFGMISHPKKFLSAFGSMFKYAASEKAYRNLIADIVTRDTHDLMKSSGLRITTLTDKLTQREEAFISSLLDRVPGIRASERAYTGFLNKLRADTFDQFIKQAERNGENIGKNSQVPKDIASVINDFTGSGNLGKNDRFAGAVPLLNSVFFSPRKIAATINIFNPLNYAKLSPTARGFAIRNLLGMVGVSATVLYLAQLAGAKVTTDTNSSDFGKATLGKTHIDVTGGNANYLVMLSRLISGKTTNSITDITKELQGGFAGQTRGDVFVKYVRNKLSPTASFIADFLYGKDSVGNPFNLTDEAKSRIMPLLMQDIISSVQNDPGNALLSSFLDTFGVGVQVYQPSAKDWNDSPTKTQSAFKQKVGDSKFQEANTKYNQQYNEWFAGISQRATYQKLSDEEKQNLLTQKKEQLQKQIFKSYGFVYKPQKQSESNKRTIKSLLQ